MQKLALSINGTPIPAPEHIPTGGLSGDGGKLIGFGITIFLVIVVVLALGFLMFGGFTWMMSGGDKTKVESAHRTIIYAIVGLVVCFLAFFIISLIGSFFSLDLLHLSL